jgi:hypothetical protein
MLSGSRCIQGAAFYSITCIEFCYWGSHFRETFGRTLPTEFIDTLSTRSPGELHPKIGEQTSCDQLSYEGTTIADVRHSSEELLRVACQEIPFTLALRPTGARFSIT